jgi:uncharacterized protein YkwD
MHMVAGSFMSGGTQNAARRFTIFCALVALSAAILFAASLDAERARANSRPCKGAGLAPREATLHQLRSAALCLINRARERHGMRSLRYSAALRRSATGHSKDMVRSGKFSHYGSRGSTLTGRVARAGYLAHAGAYAVGENIGSGPGRRFGSAVAVVRGWMHSSGHRANILNPSYRDFGVGVARGSPFGGGSRAATYTLDLGMCR